MHCITTKYIFMELTDTINNFLGSWYFTALMVILVIAAGLFLRFSLKPGGKEYKHKEPRYDRRR